MKVIFVQDVPNIAKAGQVKDVADGYARNFLFPKKYAVLATAGELKRLKTHEYAVAQRHDRTEEEFKYLAETIKQLTINLALKVGVNNRVYGSITAAHIAEELNKLTGQEIDKRKVLLEEPIRKLGNYEIFVELTKDITPKVKVVVEGK